ncbi:MAG: T9SS type A sorting domain-containing protein, partial [Saprospiraceae bacterium]|nr:T9SS type A sorting domain-containing protein [Saprospiraceae bacterium]
KLLEKTVGVQYPFVAGGEFVITGSELGTTRYPYFYNITIEKDYNCDPQRIFVEPDTTSSFDLGIDLASDTIPFGEAFSPVANSTASISNYLWQFSDGFTSLDASPAHTFEEPGYHTIYLTATIEEGCTNSAQQSIWVEPLSSLSDLNEFSGIKVFPNPAGQIVTLEFETPLEVSSVSLIDLQGKEMRFWDFNESLMSAQTFDLEEVSAGIYFLAISGQRIGRITKKIIVQ